MVTDDSRVYVDLATNWLQHGVYGQTQTVPSADSDATATAIATKIVPIDSRLPGYPAFLAVIFLVFGVGNLKAVMLAQVLVDIATCFLVADLAQRLISARAALVAFLLATLCPFLANYTAAALTETLEIFFTAVTLDCTASALQRTRDVGRIDRSGAALWAGSGAAIGGCVLLRPDGGVLLASVILYLLYLGLAAWYAEAGALRTQRVSAGAEAQSGFQGDGKSGRGLGHEWNSCPSQNRAKWSFSATSGTRALPGPVALEGLRQPVERRTAPKVKGYSLFVAGLMVAIFALAPLGPWTVRNFRTLHHFQPLAPRYANESDELVPRGFNRWAKTWLIDYASVEEIYWNVPGDKIDAEKLPARAFDDAAQKEATLAVIADYNESQDITPEVDAGFGEIATARVRAHPLRYYVVLPMLRVADMWLRPRTEILPPDVRWWEFNDDWKRSAAAVGFGLLNLAYMGTALWALVWRRARMRWVGMLVCFLLLRSALLFTLENPEPRYTLECYPVVIVLAAACLTTIRGQERGRTSASAAT